MFLFYCVNCVPLCVCSQRLIFSFTCLAYSCLSPGAREETELCVCPLLSRLAQVLSNGDSYSVPKSSKRGYTTLPQKFSNLGCVWSANVLLAILSHMKTQILNLRDSRWTQPLDERSCKLSSYRGTFVIGM